MTRIVFQILLNWSSKLFELTMGGDGNLSGEDYKSNLLSTAEPSLQSPEKVFNLLMAIIRFNILMTIKQTNFAL